MIKYYNSEFCIFLYLNPNLLSSILYIKFSDSEVICITFMIGNFPLGLEQENQYNIILIWIANKLQFLKIIISGLWPQQYICFLK